MIAGYTAPLLLISCAFHCHACALYISRGRIDFARNFILIKWWTRVRHSSNPATSESRIVTRDHDYFARALKALDVFDLVVTEKN